jgi:hypothetical protein
MKSAVSPIPKPYPNSLAVAEVTRRRPTALSTWPFVTPQTLRRSEGCKHRPRLCDEAKPGRANKGRERRKSRAGGRVRVEGGSGGPWRRITFSVPCRASLRSAAERIQSLRLTAGPNIFKPPQSFGSRNASRRLPPQNEGTAGHTSGAPAVRMASIMRSRCARNTALSLSPKARRRLIENFGLTARPVPTAARASSSRPKWARQADR